MRAFLVLLASLLAPGARAGQAPFVSPLFGDHMVLQRGKPVPVWGWAQPGARVTVSIDGRRASASAGADGRWTARLPALRAGGPYRLSIDGPRSVAFSDVMVGDVWLCAGQSNMEMGVGVANDAAREIAAAGHPNIRLFTVPKATPIFPQDVPGPSRDAADGQWLVSSPATIAEGGWGGFSAACYFFGRELRQQLGIPIGLIHASWGGTPAEAWTSLAGLRTLPEFAQAVSVIDQVARDPQGAERELDAKLAAWWSANDPGSATQPGWADPALDDKPWELMTLPTNWENAGIPALADFDGIVWFRKEVTLDAAQASKQARLSLGPVDDEDATWINGVEVGATAGWNFPRDYAVPAGLLHPGRNVIAVRVLDTGGSGGIYGAPAQLFLRLDGAEPIPLAGPWRYKVARALAQTSPLPQRWIDNPLFPTTLYNGMIAPLAPFALKGATWYQGESNTDHPEIYGSLLPTMIKSWRSTLRQGDVPVVIQQLPNFGAPAAEPGDSPWAVIREAELRASQTLPKTALSVGIDVGEEKDIHPKDKQTIGKRLALAALDSVYHRRIESSGPAPRSTRFRGSTVRVLFSHARGLTARGGALSGFAIAGADRKFYWADARIEGDAVVVSSPKVPHPVAVRYGWSDNPRCSLYNAAGLPASPFRTDDWR